MSLDSSTNIAWRLPAWSLALAAITAVVSLPVLAAVPDGTGWHELPNTKLRQVCSTEPSIQATIGCRAITAAWNGAVLDTTRNRLVIWGGGHADYFGNELYALDIGRGTVHRLNEPSLNPPTTCSHSGAMPDGSPVSRHTYNHLAYIEHADRMFAFGGATTPCGWFLNDTWTFEFASMKWQQMRPSGPIPEGNYGRVTAYDPASQKVYIHDSYYLYSYTLETNTYARLSPAATLNQRMTATIDTKRGLFIIAGAGNVYAYDIRPGSTYSRQVWNTTGDTAPVAGSFIGLAYDSQSDRIVAWNGGGTVYSLDVDKRVWTAIPLAGGPGAALSNGTFGRFAFSPATGAFVVVNSVDSNAFALRLGPTPSPPNPPTTVRAD